MKGVPPERLGMDGKNTGGGLLEQPCSSKMVIDSERQSNKSKGGQQKKKRKRFSEKEPEDHGIVIKKVVGEPHTEKPA